MNRRSLLLSAAGAGLAVSGLARRGARRGYGDRRRARVRELRPGRRAPARGLLRAGGHGEDRHRRRGPRSRPRSAERNRARGGAGEVADRRRPDRLRSPRTSSSRGPTGRSPHGARPAAPASRSPAHSSVSTSAPRSASRSPRTGRSSRRWPPTSRSRWQRSRGSREGGWWGSRSHPPSTSRPRATQSRPTLARRRR